MIKQLFRPVILSFLFFSLISSQCKHTEENTKPVISFITPANHLEVNDGDTVKIKANFTCLENLSSLSLKINIEDSTSSFFTIEKTLSSTSYQLDTFYIAHSPDFVEHQLHTTVTNVKGETTTDERHVHVLK